MTGWLAGRLVGRSVSWLVCWSFFKILRFGEYVAIVHTLINTLLIIVLYRHGIKCAITKVKHIVELKDRVLAPWDPSSISAVAELVYLFILLVMFSTFCNLSTINNLATYTL